MDGRGGSNNPNQGALCLPAFTPRTPPSRARTLPSATAVSGGKIHNAPKSAPRCSVFSSPIAGKGRKLSCDVNVGNLSVTRGSRCPHPHHVDTKAASPRSRSPRGPRPVPSSQLSTFMSAIFRPICPYRVESHSQSYRFRFTQALYLLTLIIKFPQF